MKKLYSKTAIDESGNDYNNFDTLSSIFIDDKYDGENFKLSKYYFNDELKIENGVINVPISSNSG